MENQDSTLENKDGAIVNNETADGLAEPSENAVEEPQGPIICSICGVEDENAHEFEFHYGKRTVVSKAPKVDPNVSKVMGHYVGHICHRCYKNSHLPIMALGVFLAIFIVSGSMLATIALQMGSYPLFFSLFIMFLGYGVYENYKLVKQDKKGNMTPMVLDDGSKMLIKKMKKHYMEQGADTFWTPDEYRQMERYVKIEPTSLKSFIKDEYK